MILFQSALNTFTNIQKQSYEEYIKLCYHSSTKIGYTEKHHIIPRSMGGSDEPSNLTVLTGREHFLAHMLLCEMFPQNRKLALALSFFKGHVSPEEYEAAKIINANAKKLLNAEQEQMLIQLRTANKSFKEIQNHFQIAFGITLKKSSLSGILRKLGLTENAEQRALRYQQVAETQQTQNKFNTPSREQGAAKLRGRTKQSCVGVAKVAESKIKLPSTIRRECVERKDNGQTYMQIFCWLKSLGHDFSLGGMSGMIHRARQDFNLSLKAAT